MKPARFAYEAPTSVEAALELVRDEETRALAGGQSLVPMLNFRLARPERLVDLNPLGELAYVRSVDGSLRIGAMTRQAALQRSSPATPWPLLAQAEAHVGHAAIRNRGTVGGSVAHADPAAELPVALVALDARFALRSAGGERTVDAADMFRGAMTTAIADDELLVEIEVPPVPAGARTAFVEHAGTHGDFAVAGVAVVLAPGEHAAVALLGAGPAPVRAVAAERALVAGAGAAEAALLAAADVTDDYRRALLATLTRRALEAVGA
jgi:CO/xanthine dehydrogenase FAD-binding subunit